MVAANYKAFVVRMINKYEGGYGWTAADPGGPTKYGITCYDLAQHRHQVMDSKSRWAPIVKAMSLKEAEDIYAEKYATACRFDDLKSGSDVVVFDFGVNSGPSRAIKYAQMVAGTTVDGILGPNTLKAINAMDAVSFINNLCSRRMAFLHSLGTWRTFGVGWSARVHDLQAYALALAKHDKDPEVLGSKAKSYPRVEPATPPTPTTPEVAVTPASPTFGQKTAAFFKKVFLGT